MIKKLETAEEKRTVRKLTIEILDVEKVLEQYPGVELVLPPQKAIDRKKLRPIVNALFDIGLQVPGVNAYYAADEISDESPITKGWGKGHTKAHLRTDLAQSDEDAA